MNFANISNPIYVYIYIDFLFHFLYKKIVYILTIWSPNLVQSCSTFKTERNVEEERERGKDAIGLVEIRPIHVVRYISDSDLCLFFRASFLSSGYSLLAVTFGFPMLLLFQVLLFLLLLLLLLLFFFFFATSFFFFPPLLCPFPSLWQDEILWTRAKSVSSRDRSDCRFERAIKLGLLLESELLGRSVPQGALDGTVGVDRRKCKPTCFVIIDATRVRFDRISPFATKQDNYVKKKKNRENLGKMQIIIYILAKM